MGRRATVLAAFVMVTCLLTGAAWWLALRDSLSRLAERGQADLALSGDRLTGQLQRFREMAVLMSDHPEVTALAYHPDADPGRATALLRRTADVTGSNELLLLSATGRVIASSGGDIGQDIRRQRLLRPVWTGFQFARLGKSGDGQFHGLHLHQWFCCWGRRRRRGP